MALCIGFPIFVVLLVLLSFLALPCMILRFSIIFATFRAFYTLTTVASSLEIKVQRKDSPFKKTLKSSLVALLPLTVRKIYDGRGKGKKYTSNVSRTSILESQHGLIANISDQATCPGTHRDSVSASAPTSLFRILNATSS